MNIGVGIMASRVPYVEFRQKTKLNEKTSLMDFRTWRNSESIEMILKKETFAVVDPVPVDDPRTRTFSLDPDFSARKGCFVIKKLHIICVLAVILTAGIILAFHRKSQTNNEFSDIASSKNTYGHMPHRGEEITHTDNTQSDTNHIVHGASKIEHQKPFVQEHGHHNISSPEKRGFWDPTIDLDHVDLNELKHLVQPLAYKISIQLPTDVNAFNPKAEPAFHGHVSIILRAKEDIKYIIIGASDLRIVSVNMTSLHHEEYGENYHISIDQYDADEGTLILHLSRPIRSNVKYSLQIKYDGDIQQMPYGLFQITSKISETGKTKTLIGTNTNVPFARTIFPCFDLPTQRGTFELQICRNSSMITESSGIYTNSTRQSADQCIWESFRSTDSMPLHFFGFVVSDYTFKRVPISKDRTLTIWTPYETCDEIAYALDVGPRLVDILENYFGIDLPVDHINIYPVPSVFPYLSSRLGLIIAQESDICIKDQITSEAEKEHVVKNLAAHFIEQWTGFINFENDQDNWLRESIVQYLQYIATDLAEPKWNVMEHFFADVHETEMDTDIINTHKKPLNLKYVSQLKRMNKHAPLFPIKETSVFSSHTDYSTIVYSNTDEIQIIPDIYSEIFDRKDIDKGICIIRMIHHIVGDRTFKKCLTRFLNTNKDASTSDTDFWRILTTESQPYTVSEDITLKVAVNEWIYNREYPIIKVTRDYDKNTVTFQPVVDTDKENGKNRRYFRFLPISFTTEEEKLFTATTPRFWLKQLKQVVRNDIPGLTADTWILVNPKQTNLYRVNYDEQNWNMLRTSCLRGGFPAEVRAQLIDDALFLARKGLLSYDFVMEFTKKLLSLETDYVVWNAALHHFDYMRSVIYMDQDQMYAHQRALFQEFIRSIIMPMYSNIEFHGIITKKYYALDQLTPTEHNQLLVESEIFRWACDVQIDKCSSKAKMDFNEWKRRPDPHRNPINPNLRYGTICNAMRVGDVSDFEFLYQMYTSTSSMNPNKFVYLKSLYCYQKISQVIPKILSRTLLNDYSVTHLNEVSNIWQALIENPIASTAPFDYMLMYWKSILKTYADFTPIMRNIIEGATINIHNEKQFNELMSLKDSLKNSEHTKIYEFLFVSSKHVFNRIAWKNNEMPQFLAWLEKKKT